MSLIRQIQANILKHLRNSSSSELSEFELIRKLQSSGHLPNHKDCLTQSISLFRTHFVTFHCLYDLRDRLWDKKIAHLEISPLHISLTNYHSEVEGLSQIDSLRDYYLDLNLLNTTTENDVDEALSGFWSKLNAQGAGYISERASKERSIALSILELNDPISLEEITFDEIKRQYRKLAMQHHPDRGGSNEKLQEINGAMRTLSACFK